MLLTNSHPQKSLCCIHNLGYSDICLHENCPKRCLCRACKLDHPETHLRNVFSLSEVYTGDFFASINDIILSKKESLFHRVRDKNTLLKKVNAAFFDIQNEVERILIETKTEIIQSIERFYQDLNQGHSEEFFQEIQSYLKKTSEDFKKQEISQLSTSLEQFSKAYFKTIKSITAGIQLATKFEDSSLDLQGVLDAVKTSCASLLSKTSAETSKEITSKNKVSVVKTAPQEIVSMCHCNNSSLFITGGSHGLLTLWSDTTFSCVGQVQLHDGSIDTIVYLPESTTIMTISNDSNVTFTKIASDGTVGEPKRTKALKLIRHIESVGGQNKIAMISDQGQKIRIFDATKDMREGEVIDVPKISETSKLFHLSEEKLVGLTYTNAILLFSLDKLSAHDNIRTEGIVLSACYVSESRTIHVLLKIHLAYEEAIYKINDKEIFTLWMKNKIERNAAYGLPLEIIADGSNILTVFTHGFILRKVQGSGKNFKFSEFLTHTGTSEYQKPAFISELLGKFIMVRDKRKFEVTQFD